MNLINLSSSSVVLDKEKSDNHSILDISKLTRPHENEVVN